MMVFKPYPPPEVIEHGRRAQVCKMLKQWGFYHQMRESGGIGIQTARYKEKGSGKRWSPAWSVDETQAAYCKIEETLKTFQPIIKLLLHWQYSRPVRIEIEYGAGAKQLEINRSVVAFVEHNIARRLGNNEKRRKGELAMYPVGFAQMVKQIKALREQWFEHAVKALT